MRACAQLRGNIGHHRFKFVFKNTVTVFMFLSARLTPRSMIKTIADILIAPIDTFQVRIFKKFLGWPILLFFIIFVSSHMYAENPEETRVILGFMNMRGEAGFELTGVYIRQCQESWT